MESSRRLLTLSFILLMGLSCYSQNKEAQDSLIAGLKTKTLTKEERSKYLSVLAFHHQKADTSVLLAKQALQLAQEINDPILQGEAWEELSHAERRLGNNNASLNNALKALQIYESLDLIERQAASYNQLASNYISDEDYSNAIEYFKKAIAIYVQSDTVGNEASTVLNLGEAYRLDGQLEYATQYFKKALQLNDQLKSDFLESYALGNLGMVFIEKKHVDSAKIYLQKAIDILGPLEDSYSSSIYISELGKAYNKEGNWSLAEENFLKALEIADLAKLKEQQKDISGLLAKFYEERHKYQFALKYQKQFQIYQDSLVNKENIKQREQIKAGYEIDKRESQIGLLEQINESQKFKLLIQTLGLIMVLVFAYVLYLGYTKIRKKNVQLLEQKALISKREKEKALLLHELQHRVKNNLQLIASILNLQSRDTTGQNAQEAIVEGKYRVEALSLVHRKLYQVGLDTRISAKEYIEELVLGLLYGYGASFKPSFQIEDVSLNVDVAIPMSLIINELITNALKYAYTSTVTPTLKIILTTPVPQFVNIEIIDNGIGFDQEINAKESFGLNLVSSLLEQLDGTITKTNNEGTHWNLRLKIS